MDSKIDVIAYSTVAAVAHSETLVNADIYSTALMFLMSIVSGVLGYVGGVYSDPADRLSARKIVGIIVFSAAFGTGSGMFLSIYCGPMAFIVCGAIVGWVGKDVTTLNIRSLWKAIINSFVCIARREKMKDEDLR